MDVGAIGVGEYITVILLAESVYVRAERAYYGWTATVGAMEEPWCIATQGARSEPLRHCRVGLLH